MNFEPEKFFIGLMDFFSILLPGAMLTYFLKEELGLALLDTKQIAGTEAWILLLFSSYLLGHFIFLLGSWIDDVLYDPLRNGTYHKQIEKLAEGKTLSPQWVRALASRMFKSCDVTVREAARIKERYLDPLHASPAINAFQWSKARLTLEDPAAMTTVQRFEADSKFFRSLAVVLTILIVAGAFEGRGMVVVLGLIGIVLALWRYIDLRKKSINQAYWYVITTEASKRDEALKPSYEIPPVSHAGGIVFRRRLGGLEYLMVETSKDPKEWVLPKGHIEPGEPMRETAVREVREESGVWARILTEPELKVKPVKFMVNEKTVRVQFYVMELVEEGKAKDSRKHDWFSFARAIAEAPHEKTHELLTLVNEHLRMRSHA